MYNLHEMLNQLRTCLIRAGAVKPEYMQFYLTLVSDFYRFIERDVSLRAGMALRTITHGCAQ